MKDNKVSEKKAGFISTIFKNKYALLALAAGLILLLWSPGSKKEETQTEEISAPQFSVKEEEARLQTQLSRIRGAGRVSVLLSVESSVSRELAESEEGALVVSENGRERVVELYYVNPEYRGAVVVCEGAGAAEVRLRLFQAVSAFTGLTSDKISIMAME